MLDHNVFPTITTSPFNVDVLPALQDEVQKLVFATVSDMEIDKTDMSFLQLYTDSVLERSFAHLLLLKTSDEPIELKLFNGKIYFVSERGRGFAFKNLLTATNPFTMKDVPMTASVFDEQCAVPTSLDVARSAIRFALGRLEQKNLPTPLMYVVETNFTDLIASLEG
ncbi:hypothetical protein VCHA53O466_50422 [Vibrio chagasii]|nr:hypothetical protein VCHA53O466_50422 [Vibrio chagasii]